VVKSIETAGAWMVLKRVENSPEYGALLEDTLRRGRGRARLQTACWTPASNGRGILFVSSPEFDHAVPLGQLRQFLVHIHGEKFFTIFDNNDRSIVGDDEIERSMTKHRNLKYDDSFAPRGSEFHLFAGDAAMCPISGRTGSAPPIRIRSRWRSPGRPVTCAALNDLHFFIRCCAHRPCRTAAGRQPIRRRAELAFYRTCDHSDPPAANLAGHAPHACAGSRSASARIIT